MAEGQVAVEITLYSVLVYAHVVMFVYWLGGDLGVFLAAKYVANRNLSLDERFRFLHLLAAADMGPRTALILIVPLGFHMSAIMGLIDLSGAAIAGIWVFGLIWLAMGWWLYLNEGKPQTVPVKKIDLLIRVAVIVVMAGLGIYSLATGGPFLTDWVALKALLFAVVVSLGLYLRSVVTEWIKGFGMVRSGENVEQGNDIIEAAYGRSKVAALTLWFLVAVIAFLGNVKPI